jgi:hypothetical protein
MHTVFQKIRYAKLYIFCTVLIWFCSVAFTGNTLQAQSNLVQAEFFWDTDPGFGLATQIPISTPAPVLNNQSLSINISSLSKGVHNLFLRTKDALGVWSITNSITIFNHAAYVLPNITYVEYFFDTDPGAGNATPISFIPNTVLSNIPFTANITSLASGAHTMFIRAKDANGVWSIVQTIPVFKISTSPIANIVQCEYIIDDVEPGFGNGISIPITAGQVITNQLLNINIQPLSFGHHSVSIRSKDAYGSWSVTNRINFFKDRVTVLPALEKAEYFVDTDPGFGNAIQVPISTGLTALTNIPVSVNLSVLADGMHRLYMRTQDTFKAWSVTQSHLFMKQTIVPQANLTKAEYFIDTDPGIGNATNIPVAATNTITAQSVSISLASITDGVHNLYIRTKDANNWWSITNNVVFYKQTIPPVTNITRVEYYFDTDPGFGNATSVPFTAGTTLSNIAFTPSIASLSKGMHTMFVRALDALGEWSITNQVNFYKEQIQPPTKIMYAEYFVNTDPGIGLATPIAIAQSNTITAHSFVAVIGSLPVSTNHNLFIRTRDSLGKWSITNRHQFTVNGPLTGPPILVTATSSATKCFGDSTGKIICAAPILVNAPVTYAIAPNIGTQSPSGTFNNLPAGTYTVTGTDANSNSATTTVVVNNTAIISPSVTLTPQQCHNIGSNTLSASASGGRQKLAAPFYTFEWYNGTTLVNSSATYSNVPAGTYSLRVKDSANCMVSAGNYVVMVPTAVVANAVVSAPVQCKGGMANVSISASGGTPMSLPLYNGTGVQAVVAGTYTFTVSDANACTSTASVTVTEPAIAFDSINVIPDSSIRCFGGSTTLSLSNVGGTGPFVWRYHQPIFGPVVIGTAFTVSAGTYLFSAVDNFGCVRSKSITVTQPNAIATTITLDSNLRCFGGSTTLALTASGGIVPFSNVGNYTVSAGTFSVTVTDAQGCSVNASSAITQPSQVTATIVSSTPMLCHGGTTTYSVVAGGGIAPYTGAGLLAFTGGAHTITVVDANACTATLPINVFEPSPIVLINDTLVPLKCKGDTVVIKLNASGGSGIYTGNDTLKLTAGSYTFTVQDANGCSKTTVINITEPSIAFAANATLTQGITCFGDSATVAVLASGGIAPYIGATNYKRVAGNHNFVVSDALGCTKILPLTITEPAMINVNSSGNFPTVCGGNNAIITLTATGGTGPITGLGVYTVSVGGTHTYTVQDSVGCTVQAFITVPVPNALLANASASAIACNGGTSSVFVSANGGVAPYTGTGLFTKIAGTYTIQVTDAIGCVATTVIVITQPAAIVYSTNQTWCDSVLLPWGAYAFSSGTYQHQYTSPNGCDSIRIITAVVNPSYTTLDTVVSGGVYTLPWGTVVNTNGLYSNHYSSISSCDSFVQKYVVINLLGVQLCAKAILNGPFSPTSGLMYDSLRTKSLLPNTDPYVTAPYNNVFTHVNTNSNIAMPSVFAATGANAIVDWVFVQLRDKNNMNIVLFTQAALIQRDGDIVDASDGVSYVQFPSTTPDSYFVSIKHRNHLGISTANKVYLSMTPNCINLSNGSTALYMRQAPFDNATPLTGATKPVGAVRTMYAGNCGISTQAAARLVTYGSTITADRAMLLTAVGNTGTTNGYLVWDCDMNGFARFNGLQPDRLVILNTCLGSTIINVHEQTPN